LYAQILRTYIRESSVAVAKKSKTYRLSEAKIAAAQRILGTRTATAAIEAALDLVVFREELLVGTAALLGTELAPFDRDRA
jgi:hypothetical protein